MSFRKRNIGIAGPSSGPRQPLLTVSQPLPAQAPGSRPSPLDGRPTTSTGTQTLDDLLAGHAGLALGNSLLIEENGSTDFAGALLRFYAAEGIVQGHKVHVVGFGEQWGRELPGLTGAVDGETETKIDVDKEKMKIAWRYESLGEHGAGRAGSRGGTALPLLSGSCVHKETFSIRPATHVLYLQLTLAAAPIPNRTPIPSTAGQNSIIAPTAFSHNFDLTKRLCLSQHNPINYLAVFPTPATNPFTTIIPSLTHSLTTTSPTTIHRLIIPTLLSPLLYSAQDSDPKHLLPFLHSLRALLRTHSTRLTAMITLPLSLHPRSTGLVRWIEHLCDGVLELAPFPHNLGIEPPLTTSGKTAKREEDTPQGMLKVHKLPILSEKGGGGGGGDDLAFSLSRRRFVVKAFSLPPVEGDQVAQRGEAEGGRVKVDIEF